MQKPTDGSVKIFSPAIALLFMNNFKLHWKQTAAAVFVAVS